MTDLEPDDHRSGKPSADELASNNFYEMLCNADAEEYFMNIKDDLSQVDRLVSDAVNNLVINFKYISKLTKTHHDMVLAIEKMAVPEESRTIIELLEKQMIIADKIEQELEMTVTSLQFGDLVTQLLAHTVKQVESLNIELQRIDRQVDWKNEQTPLLDKHKGISKAVSAANNRTRKKPVVQQGMQMGDIELF